MLILLFSSSTPYPTTHIPSLASKIHLGSVSFPFSMAITLIQVTFIFCRNRRKKQALTSFLSFHVTSAQTPARVPAAETKTPAPHKVSTIYFLLISLASLDTALSSTHYVPAATASMYQALCIYYHLYQETLPRSLQSWLNLTLAFIQKVLFPGLPWTLFPRHACLVALLISSLA